MEPMADAVPLHPPAGALHPGPDGLEEAPDAASPEAPEDRKTSVSPAPSATRPHLLILRFALLNLVAVAILGAAWAQGLVDLVLRSDRTHICVVIFVVFLGGLAVCARKVWRTSIELEAARRPDWQREKALDELLAPLRHCEPEQRGNLFGALRMRLSQRITAVRHVAGNLVLLGLVGTVVGFIVALSGVDPTQAGDVKSVAPMVAGLIEGMSTALYTTLVGSVLNIWLMANYQLLAGGTVQLIAALAELIENHARPRLHR